MQERKGKEWSEREERQAVVEKDTDTDVRMAIKIVHSGGRFKNALNVGFHSSIPIYEKVGVVIFQLKSPLLVTFNWLALLNLKRTLLIRHYYIRVPDWPKFNWFNFQCVFDCVLFIEPKIYLKNLYSV